MMPVPAWLEIVYPTPGQESRAKVGTLTFSTVAVVWTWRGQYFVRPLVGTGCVMSLKDSDYVTVEGQYPGAVKKPVVLDCSPIVPDWLATGVVVGVVLGMLS